MISVSTRNRTEASFRVNANLAPLIRPSYRFADNPRGTRMMAAQHELQVRNEENGPRTCRQDRISVLLKRVRFYV
jgi:hypothetical protein